MKFHQKLLIFDLFCGIIDWNKLTERENDGTRRKQQVKSKQRVVDRGEVFTAEREVNAMLDLVKQETERIDSRF